MKAGLSQKEGEEGDVEKLCAIKAYVRKRDILIQALACSPTTPVFLQDSFGRDISRGARREENLQIPTGQCKGAIASGPFGWG